MTMQDMFMLRTGIQEASALVKIVALQLREMMNPDLEKGARMGDMLALYDLVSKCRDRNYQFFGNNEELLIQRGLVERSGHVHDSVRNIVLASVEGDGMDMRLVNPATGK